MEIDDDIVIIQDNKPHEPTEDPLEVNQHNFLDNDNTYNRKNETENIISLDSSDDETYVVSRRNEEPISELKESAQYRNSILGTYLQQKLHEPPSKPHTDIIDLDAEDSDPLAPLRSFINPSENKSNTVTGIANSTTNHTEKSGKNLHLKNKTNSTTQHKIIKIFKDPQETVIKNTKKLTTCTSIKKGKITSNSDIKSDQNLNKNLSNQLLTNVETEERSLEPNKLHIISSNDSANVNSQNLTYLGKIIRIPGQPSLIENSCGLIFRAENHSPGLKNVDTENLEVEENLYKTFLKCTNTAANNVISAQDLPKTNQKGNTIPIGSYQSQDPNSTVLDLNLNINNKEPSSTSLVNTVTFPSQNILSVPNDSTGRYNLAFGLVLNVNDNQQKLNQVVPHSQFPNLNNVALDLSFNVNNKEKPSTMTSEQVLQNSLILESTNQDVISDDKSNTVRKTYCCCYCSFKTVHFELLKSHVCPRASSVKAISNITEPVQVPSNKRNTMNTNQISDMFCCVVCSFQTFDLEHMKSHDCKCVATDSSNFNLDKNSENQTHTTDNSVDKMYCCIACSFKTTDIEIMKPHICPSVSSTLTDKVDTHQNTYIKKPNLEHIETPIRWSIVESENHQKRKVPTIYSCAACTYQTEDVEVINSHKCFSLSHKQSLKIANTTGNQTLGNKTDRPNKKTSKLNTVKEMHKVINQTKFYCCVSCPFKTAVFEHAQAHRCRKQTENDTNVSVSIPDIQNSSNKLDKFVKQTNFICEICEMAFKSKHLLFQHLRQIHFCIRRLFGCHICSDTFQYVKGLLKHISEHGVETSQEYIEIFVCAACDFRTNYLHDMKRHFDKHIESYQFTAKEFRRYDEQTDPDKSKKISKKYLYECILCGKKTNSISIWLTHYCKKPKGMNQKRKDMEKQAVQTEPIDHTPQLSPTNRVYKRKNTNLLLCYYCKRHIIREALKCDNSNCEHLYHLECVETYRRLIDSEELSNSSNWFCIDCNKEMLPIQDDIGNISYCLDFADKEYLREVEKQKSMASELKRIKEENITMKEEFDRIKKFIMECKSERINNSVVNSVCTIVESFINAGMDISD